MPVEASHIRRHATTPPRGWLLVLWLGLTGLGFLVVQVNREVIRSLPLVAAADILLFLIFAACSLLVLEALIRTVGRGSVLPLRRSHFRAVLVAAAFLSIFLVQYLAFAYLHNPGGDIQGHYVSYLRVSYGLIQGWEGAAHALMQPTRGILRGAAARNPDSFLVTTIASFWQSGPENMRLAYVGLALVNTLFWVLALAGVGLIVLSVARLESRSAAR